MTRVTRAGDDFLSLRERTKVRGCRALQSPVHVHCAEALRLPSVASGRVCEMASSTASNFAVSTRSKIGSSIYSVSRRSSPSNWTGPDMRSRAKPGVTSFGRARLRKAVFASSDSGIVRFSKTLVVSSTPFCSSSIRPFRVGRTSSVPPHQVPPQRRNPPLPAGEDTGEGAVSASRVTRRSYFLAYA